MTSPELENLAEIGKLKREPPRDPELRALIHAGQARLHDAQVPELAIESRFDLAYNAAHALALAALRHRGYRSENRYIVFQTLQHTLQLEPAVWRVLAKAHGERNHLEYEGGGTVDERLVADLIDAAKVVEQRVMGLTR